ncbi:hypothetical protein ACFWAT_11850 [Streptomyces syringium]
MATQGRALPHPEVMTMAAPNSLPRIVVASLIGTTIEWYDNSSGQG